MATKIAAEVWPKIRVEHANPEIPDEIITLEEAARRFKLDERTQGHLRRGEIAGTSVNRSGEAGRDVRTIWRYTQVDAIRNAAPDLFRIVNILDEWFREANSVSGSAQVFGDSEETLKEAVRAAIKKTL